MLLSLVVTFGSLTLLIPYLRAIGTEQTVREDGPVWHNAKGKKPTMGGIGFILGISTAILTTPPLRERSSSEPYLILLCALSFAVIGFFDDYMKVIWRRNLGLTAKQKIVMQLIAAVAFICALAMGGYYNPELAIPFTGATLRLGFLFPPVAVFIILATVNGVNLTDGLDGLAASVTIPIAVLFMAIASRYRSETMWNASSALFGGLLGYLPYNLPKAKVIMGDVGAFFLGGLVVSMGFLVSMPMLIAVFGIVYVLEVLSDVIQLLWMRRTGKRFFKMAPLHHHFEMLGYTELQIDLLFTAISTVGCAVAYFAYTSFYPVL